MHNILMHDALPLEESKHGQSASGQDSSASRASRSSSLSDLRRDVNPDDIFIRFQVYNSKVSRGKR